MIKKSNIIFILSFIFSSLYLIWRTFWTLPLNQSMGEIIFAVILLLSEIITTFTSFELIIHKMRNDEKRLVPPVLQARDYPEIDIFIATHNESVDLLYKTVNACTFLEYPDLQLVHIYICDNQNRPEVKHLAEHFGVGYIGLEYNQHAKAGNFNHALSMTHSPLIVTFDADMIPERTFLMKTVPYFFMKDTKTSSYLPIALVQTPQSFYNQDLFQFHLFSETTIPNEQDFFSKEINVLRNAHFGASYTGSNAVILREALEKIGGFPYHTVTEDFETSIRLQKAGYWTYSTQESLASGLSTTTIPSMIQQRIRWAQGVIQSIYNTHACTTSSLSLGLRLSYLCAFLYWWSFLTRLIFILAPILFALFDLQFVQCHFGELLIFWLPSSIFYHLSLNALSTQTRNQRWSQIIDTILAPFLIIPVLLETLGIHQKIFKVTNKKKATMHTRSLFYMIPHLILVILTILAIIRYGMGKYGSALFYSSVILFWLFYNLVTLCFAIFFMLGRPSYRAYERFSIQEAIDIHFHHQTYQGMSVDFSYVSLSFSLSLPFYVPADIPFYIEIKTDQYQTKLPVQLLYVKVVQGKWIYVVTFQDAKEEDYRQYLQIIHDRKHSLPSHIDEWSTLYDDLYRNIQLRFQKRQQEQRQTFRIPVEQVFHLTNGMEIFVVDFNYHYLLVKDFQGDKLKEYCLNWYGMIFQLRFKKQVNHQLCLLEVINFEELFFNKKALKVFLQHLIYTKVDET